jgi:hypothetical protein
VRRPSASPQSSVAARATSTAMIWSKFCLFGKTKAQTAATN